MTLNEQRGDALKYSTLSSRLKVCTISRCVSPSGVPPGGACSVSPFVLVVGRLICLSRFCRTAVLENACASLLTKERENEALRARLGMAGGGGGGDVLDLMRQAATARDNDNHRFARMDSRNSEVILMLLFFVPYTRFRPSCRGRGLRPRGCFLENTPLVAGAGWSPCKTVSSTANARKKCIQLWRECFLCTLLSHTHSEVGSFLGSSSRLSRGKRAGGHRQLLCTHWCTRRRNVLQHRKHPRRKLLIGSISISSYCQQLQAHPLLQSHLQRTHPPHPP